MKSNNLFAISLIAVGTWFLLKAKSISSPPKFIIGDIIAIEDYVYTVHGVDIYKKEYFLYTGRYPYDTAGSNWVSSSYIDSIATKIDHVEITYLY